MIIESSVFALWLTNLLMVSLFITVQLRSKKAKMTHEKIELGMLVNNLTLFTPANEKVRLLDVISGKVTLFCFVANQCKYCKEIIPILDSIKQENPDINIQFISLGEVEGANKILISTKTRIPVLGVNTRLITKKMGIQSFPFCILVDQHGKVLKREIISKNDISSWLKFLPEYNDNITDRKDWIV